MKISIKLRVFLAIVSRHGGGCAPEGGVKGEGVGNSGVTVNSVVGVPTVGVS